MSGLAEILLDSGFRVSGSDLKRSIVTDHLKSKGAKLAYKHRAENLSNNVSLLVFSSAVSQQNPEIIEAKARGIPVVRRAEVLAELMRLKFGVAIAGSHGKTTTTTMAGHILECAGLDPTVVVGGQVKTIGSGGKLGYGDFLVAESDESDGSFELLTPSIAVVTNIDREHLNAYSSMEELKHSFFNFVSKVPFYGLAVLCADNAATKQLACMFSRRSITYGLSSEADIFGCNLTLESHGTSFDVYQHGEFLERFFIPLPGRHIVLNTLAAIAVGLELGLEAENMRSALTTLPQVKRRLELLGKVNGITVISDYAHHPTEIRCTIETVRERLNGMPLKVVFEPHRYSRVAELYGDFLELFKDADTLFVSDIYSAVEKELPGISSQKFFEHIKHPNKHRLGEIENMLGNFASDICPGDTILFLGAGAIGHIAEEFISLNSHRSVLKAEYPSTGAAESSLTIKHACRPLCGQNGSDSE